MKICKFKRLNQWLKSIDGQNFEFVSDKKEASIFIFSSKANFEKILNETFLKTDCKALKQIETINVDY